MSRSTAEMLTSHIVAIGNGDVVRVIFYGSRARGMPQSPDSDWDFVVVLDHAIADIHAEEQRFRAAARKADGLIGPLQIDVWPISESEWLTARDLTGHPMRAADLEGEVLYVR